MVFYHDAVACHLRDDAGCGDAEAEGVAADEGGLRDGEIAHGEAVNEHVVGGELLGGAAHGFVGGAEDVDAINFLRLDDGECDADVGAGGEFRVDALAAALAELLGVIQHVVREIGGEDDGCGDDRAGERAASGFIYARYKKQTSRTKRILMREVAGHFPVTN